MNTFTWKREKSGIRRVPQMQMNEAVTSRGKRTYISGIYFGVKQIPTLFLLLIIGFMLMLEYYEYPVIKLAFVDKNSNKLHRDAERVPKYPCVSNNFRELELRVDRTRPSRADIVREAQAVLPTFPIAFWEEIQDRRPYYENESCANFPDVYKLEVNNVYWQIFRAPNRTFYLFGAYYDARKDPCIRLLAMCDTYDVEIKSYCQIWFADVSETCVVETVEYFTIAHSWWGETEGYSYPYLITCPVPQEHRNRVPSFVSLVARMCDEATNNFRVIFNHRLRGVVEQKGAFAVCVKMMDSYYADESVRLVEWIELLGLLGAEKIFFYLLHAHDNITKVFRHYEQRGKVEVVPFTLPAGRVNTPPSFQRLALYSDMGQYYLDEKISLNDCFYRNMYKYDYITAIDTDEVILPTEANNWIDLMKTVKKKASSKAAVSPITHYSAKNVLFNSVCDDSAGRHEDIPSYMHMLQHVISHTLGVPQNPKVFIDTKLAMAVSNHGVEKSLTGKSSKYEFSTDEAQLQHYRSKEYLTGRYSCDELKANMTTDTSIWKYKEQLINRTLATLHDLGFFEPD